MCAEVVLLSGRGQRLAVCKVPHQEKSNQHDEHEGLKIWVWGAGSEDKSCKTAFAMALLQELCGQGERSLVFSQSRVGASPD